MNEESYLIERLDDQINWYDRKSQYNQKWFKRLKKVEMIFSAAIPIAVSFMEGPLFLKIFIATAGGIISIATATHGIYNFQENWIEYRNTCETLKHEKYLYLTKTGIYAEAEDPFRLLVERCESIISHENINWAQIQMKQLKNQKEKN